ncbi:MAG: hypothetical protein KME15_26645 [Drouetiella hepatica Uher 2000/2452]|uniref:Uncharacterized protein n=1 Tax=Drouetiella hepatica Uher 2000/2452 TaxID=904376 RepID=A0A951QGL1_9CYAN|nr:hypothetical protein [Drouetiella hepatica Uher 2000/2452]
MTASSSNRVNEPIAKLDSNLCHVNVSIHTARSIRAIALRNMDLRTAIQIDSVKFDSVKLNSVKPLSWLIEQIE